MITCILIINKKNENNNNHMSISICSLMDPISNFSSSDIFQNTCLNNIVPDLHPIVDRYLNSYSPFSVGIHGKEYIGYRLITTADLENGRFIASLTNDYRKNNGFRSLDNFSGLYLCGDKIDLYISILPIRFASYNSFCKPIAVCENAPYNPFCKPIAVCENIVITLNTMAEDINYVYDNINKISYKNRRKSIDDAGLFILKKYIFA